MSRRSAVAPPDVALFAVDQQPPLPQSPLRTEVVLVTPRLAQKWLAHNHEHNREVSWDRVETMAADMEAGAWKLTHQGICFDANGSVIDGQHRLHAIVRSGASVAILVAHNTVGDIGDPMDRDQGRTLRYVTGRPTRQIAALNVLRMLEHGSVINSPMSVAMVETLAAAYANELAAIGKVSHMNKLTGGAVAAIAWAWPVAPEIVLAFAHSVATGEMIKRGDPSFAFRNWKERAGAKPHSAWDTAIAGLSCIRYALSNKPLANVYVTQNGYRGITTKRRAMGVPRTPPVGIVPTVSTMVVAGEDDGGGS